MKNYRAGISPARTGREISGGSLGEVKSGWSGRRWNSDEQSDVVKTDLIRVSCYSSWLLEELYRYKKNMLEEQKFRHFISRESIVRM